MKDKWKELYYRTIKENRIYRKNLWKVIQENESLKKLVKKQEDTIIQLIRHIERKS